MKLCQCLCGLRVNFAGHVGCRHNFLRSAEVSRELPAGKLDKFARFT
jgi:hypothetical protein